MVHPRTRAQLRASDPAAHVWVSASAGTGKTQVLTDRMLRLMLAGSQPDRILALTFTRAAAAEMQIRLTRRLGEWMGADEARLVAELQALGINPEAAMLARARSLFTLALEVPGGLKVQTLHGFAQGLLAAFPVEAGLPPGFVALDERAAQQLQARALSELVAEAVRANDSDFLDDLAELAVARGENGVRRALQIMLGYTEGLAAFSMPGTVDPALRRYLKLKRPTAEAAVEEVLAPGIFDDSRLRAFADGMEFWGAATGLANAAAARAWLAGDAAARRIGLGDLRKLVLTQKDEPQKCGHAVKKTPELRAIIDDLAADVLAVEALAARYVLADHAARHLRVGMRYVAHYARLKRAEVAIDYDDMIAIAGRLLGEPGMPDWVGWKLDQRFDHLLVDEAQDTNARQWAILRKVSDEYFAGAGTREKRSLFVVGDYKQAIYGFQGTDPRLFESERESVAVRAETSGRPLDLVPLDRSFRSGPAVLELVDAVLKNLGHAALGMREELTPHVANRAEAASEVVIWPLLVAGAEDDPEDGNGEEPNQEEAERQMAATLASQVRAWLTVGHSERLWLAAQGRWAHAGDILILLRKRSKLMTGLVAALHQADVPVAGVDRLLLTEPYAVLDLMALMRFAVQPEDDLNLAQLLVSPFLGWKHEEVRAISRDRPRSLWEALGAAGATDPRAEAARDWLGRVLAMADYATPYVFLDTILSGELAGRRLLLARLGQDAQQAIDELLCQAVAYEARHLLSLEAFLAWLSADGSEVKRDPDAAAGEVRLMTIHGAKGLEAPVVVLADAAHGARPRQDRFVPVKLLGQDAEIPLFFPSAKSLSGPPRQILDNRRLAEEEEALRLLYVGLTRAVDHLFIGGAVSPKVADKLQEEDHPSRWWGVARQAMAGMDDVETLDTPLWPGETLRVRRGNWQQQPDADIVPADATLRHHEGLVLTKAPPPTRPTRPLTPSAMEDGPATGPAAADQRARLERGRWMHGLFQYLPDVDPAKRADVARRWLRAHGAGDEVDGILKTVLAVLDLPELANLFGPDALAEAPIAGLVGDAVIAGTVDRLLVTPEYLLLVDFKTGLSVPASAETVAPAYLRQMAAYRAVLALAFPGRRIDTMLLFTHGPKLLALPDALLDAFAPET